LTDELIIFQILVIFVSLNLLIMIPNGFKPSPRGRHITNNSSEESKWLALVLGAIEDLNASVHSIAATSLVFVVGTTTGAPTNGASTWTVSTVPLSGTPRLLINGVDTPISASGQVITLGSGTFATGNILLLIS
jgi:hypothetical protein